MKERPTLFSTPMVQAILDGRKTVTRRVVDPQPHNDEDGIRFPWATFFNSGNVFTWDDDGIGGENWQANDYPNENKYEQALRRTQHSKPCRHGKAGDILWVRETWGELYDTCDHPELPDNPQERWSLGYVYKADDYKHTTDTDGFFTGWKPSIHMPKEACRLKLEILSIRVERLHDITEEECFREGIDADNEDYQAAEHYQIGGSPIQGGSPAKFAFIALWQRINGQESWNSNPWVWRIEFKKLLTNEDN